MRRTEAEKIDAIISAFEPAGEPDDLQSYWFQTAQNMAKEIYALRQRLLIAPKTEK